MRHGQSEANVEHIWQGTGSSLLTELGRSQAASAGLRLAARQFSVVVSSDLDRAIDSARMAGFEPDQREIWREGDLGEWEGLKFAEVVEQFGDELRRLNDGEEVPLGTTGESTRQVSDRALKGIEEILSELDDGQSALVVTHGGLLNGLIRRILGMPPGGRRLGIPANTSLSEVTFGEDAVRLNRFNDAHHLGPVTTWTREHLKHRLPVFELIRHGQTDSNVSGRVQGHADGGLNDLGREQARKLAAWIGDVDASYTSSLGRARETAEIVFGAAAHPIDALREIDMGAWNGALWAELATDDLFHRVFVEHRDLRRGGTGETWVELQIRMEGFLSDSAGSHEGQRVGVVSHAGSIKAIVGGALGLDFASSRALLGTLDNTSVTQVIMMRGGPMVASYNVAGHLEGRPQSANLR